MKQEVIGVFIFIFLISFTSSLDVGNRSHILTSAYAPSGNILGWMNISLDDDLASSLFEDGRGNSITLLDLMNTPKNSDFEPNCSIKDCLSDYSANSRGASKTFTLTGAGDSMMLGIKLEGEISSIDSLGFEVEATTSASCNNQLKIDFFNNGNFVTGNNKSSSEICSASKTYGCFRTNEATLEGTIDTTPYCQKVTLPEAPEFKLGAWVKEQTAGEVTMHLYKNSEEVANCELEGVSSTGGEVSCDAGYLVSEEGDYYVCISSDSGNYKIKSQTSNKCGFHSEPVREEIASYQIFAEAKRFGDIGELLIDNSFPGHGNTLAQFAQEYISSKYGDFDCSGDGCIIPIKFTSGQSSALQVTVKNLSFLYDKSGVSGIEEKNFYELEETASTVSSTFQKLYLDEGNFSVPNTYGNYTFELSFDGDEILEYEVMVERAPGILGLTPTTTASAFPTTFNVITNTTANITDYKWDFGNNNTKRTTKDTVTFTYATTGTYTLKVTAIDINNKEGSREFKINVRTPEQEINQTLEKNLENLKQLKAQIENFSSFTQESLNSALKISEIEASLESIQVDYETSASSEAEYNSLMTRLLAISVPNSIQISLTTIPLTFYAKESTVDLDFLKTIGGGDYELADASKYTNAVNVWNFNNLATKVSLDEYSVYYDNYHELLLKVFEFEITENRAIDENYYFILESLNNLEFARDYGQIEGEYASILLTGSETIIFSTTEDLSFTELPVFISPSLTELSVATGPGALDEKMSKWVIFALIIAILFIIGGIVYIVMQVWYKKKYETHLFKNRNNLYNLITYIENSKQVGLTEFQIIKRLRNVGWTSEQIRYVTKKHSGERTGMLEIPIEKIIEIFRKKEIKQRKGRFPPMVPPKFHQPKRRFSPRRFPKKY